MALTNETADAIREMVTSFLPYCTDRSTMTELQEMASDSKKWREAHKLFRRIRNKTLKADQLQNELLQRQYSFEEICAKTLYNMADHHEGFSAEYLPPFDEDSPFWVISIALSFANSLGMNGLRIGSSLVRSEKAADMSC